MRLVSFALAALAIMAMTPAPAAGQGVAGGSVRGSVLAETGAPVANARISLRSASTGIVGTWQQIALTAGIKDLQLVIKGEANDSLTGTWTMTRTYCNCQLSGEIMKTRSFRTSASAHIEFGIERYGYGVVAVNIETSEYMRGSVSLGYDFEPDIEVRDGVLELRRKSQ